MMKRSWLALVGTAGTIAVLAVGGFTVAQAADPGPNPKSTLPANVNGKDPNAEPIAEPTKQGEPPTKEQKIETAKKFLAAHPIDGVVCFAPDGTPIDALEVRWQNPEKVPTEEQKQGICNQVSKDTGVKGLRP